MEKESSYPHPEEELWEQKHKNIHSQILCGSKKLENEGMAFNWGMAEQIVVYVGDGILLC